MPGHRAQRRSAAAAAAAVLLVLTATQLHVACAQAAAPANATADAAAPDLAARARRVPRGGRMCIQGVRGIAGATNSSLELERCVRMHYTSNCAGNGAPLCVSCLPGCGSCGLLGCLVGWLSTEAVLLPCGWHAGWLLGSTLPR